MGATRDGLFDDRLGENACVVTHDFTKTTGHST